MIRVNRGLNKLAIWFLIGFFIFLYSFWSIQRHNRFQTDAVDLAIFDQPLWRYSRFETPLSTIKFNTFPGEHILGDHFHPLIIPLAFLFRVWDDVRVILLAQAVLAVFSVYPIYLLAKKSLGLVFALALSFAYLAFIGFQTAIDYDFHEITVGVGVISAAIYFLWQGRFRPFYLFLWLGFLLKEDVPLIFAALGIWTFLYLKKYKQGIFIISLSLFYYLLLVKFIIPYFKHDRFAYEELDLRIGRTLGDLFYKSLTQPGLVLEVFFLPAVKFKTMVNLLASFSFLPLLSPLSLVPLLPNFISRFLTGLPQRWLIRYQYNIVLTPFLAWGSVLGMMALQKFLVTRRLERWSSRLVLIFSALLIISPVVQTLRTHSPLTRILDPRSYAREERFAINYKLLSLIPKDPNVSVMAQSPFVPHLSHRYEIYRYEPWVLEKLKPQYVLMSVAEGSDPPYGREVKLEIINNLAKAADYEVLYFDGVRLLLKRR